jgi:hypothetical protein
MSLYKVTFFVPESHLESVKMAMFKSGAGRIGDYEQCCWQVLGTGQFLPRDGSNAFIGETNRLETLKEYRVEMVCGAEFIKAVIKALLSSHPYEEPAYDVIKTVDINTI